MVASHVGIDVEAEFLKLSIEIVVSRIEVGIETSRQLIGEFVESVIERGVASGLLHNESFLRVKGGRDGPPGWIISFHWRGGA